MYAKIVLLRKLGEFDNELTYKIEDSLIEKCRIGSFVKVPFRNIEVNGVVVEISDTL